MKSIILSVLAATVLALPTYAQTSQFLEDFEGGAADWLDDGYSAVTHHASGGHDGGAYISVTADINTAGNGNFGAYTLMRCGQFNSQAPAQDCSGGAFVGNWYFTTGTQVLRMWFRHNSANPLQPQVRIANPFNSPGGSGVLPAVPPNTWTLITLPIDAQDPIWDKQWGSLVPSATKIFRNVNRIQPGYFFDPDDPTYTESNVKFDVDDVEILGSPVIAATVDVNQGGGQQGHGHNHPGVSHPHHDGGPDAVAGLDDPIRVIAYGATGQLVTDDIVTASVRMGRLGGPNISGEERFFIDDDTDGANDAEFSVLTGDAFARAPSNLGSCQASYAIPTAVEFRAELVTGEVVAGEDTSFSANCNAQCHTEY